MLLLPYFWVYFNTSSVASKWLKTPFSFKVTIRNKKCRNKDGASPPITPAKRSTSREICASKYNTSDHNFISRAAWLMLLNWIVVFASEMEPRNLKLTQFANRVLPKAIDLFCVSGTHSLYDLDCVPCCVTAGGWDNVCIHTIDALFCGCAGRCEERWVKSPAFNSRWVSTWLSLQNEMRSPTWRHLCVLNTAGSSQKRDVEAHMNISFYVYTPTRTIFEALSNAKTNITKGRDRYRLFKTLLGQRWAQNSRWAHFCVNFS